jgi:hypothetical protein
VSWEVYAGISNLPLNESPTFKDDFFASKLVATSSGSTNNPFSLLFEFKAKTLALSDGSLGNASQGLTGLYLSTLSRCCSLVILPSRRSFVEFSNSGVRTEGFTGT